MSDTQTLNGPSPLASFQGAIKRWEGEYEASPNDRGNYAHGHDGRVRLVGTMRGVTPDAYATFKAIDPGTVTAEAMRAITLETASQIAVSLYYVRPRLHILTWSPVVAIIVDVCWGSGQRFGIAMLQRLIGVTPDGEVGPATAHALDIYLESHAVRAACSTMVAMRVNFYDSISQPGSRNAIFRDGWRNRAKWFSPDNSDWWTPWAAWSPPAVVGSSRPVEGLSV